MKIGAVVLVALLCGLAEARELSQAGCQSVTAAKSPFQGSVWIGAEPGGAQPEFATSFVSPGGRGKIFISGLGQYAAYLNGRRLGGDTAGLQPGFSDTRRTVFYDAYEPELLPGTNTLTVLLGNGLYRVPNPGRGRYTKFVGAQGELKLLVGGDVKSGSDWRWRRTPLAFSHIYGGDDWYWNIPYGAWQPVKAATPPTGELVKSPFTISLQETKAGRKVAQIAENRELWDFGQNACYVPEIRVKGPRGAGVRVFFAEKSNRAGTDLMGAGGETGSYVRGTSIGYILRGDPDGETYRPPFFWWGYRVARVELARPHDGGDLPQVVSFVSHVLQADVERAGDFACSNPILNRIRDLVWWAQRSNMTWTFTDCPHREKLGWQEQNNCHVDQMMWEWNAYRVYEKVMRDVADTQSFDGNGFVPDICPESTRFSGGFRNSPEWGSTAVMLPWIMYEWTGDDTLVRRHYEGMKKYFSWLERFQGDGRILRGGLGDWFQLPSNGGVKGAPTDPALTATAYFFQDARIISRCAALLGKADEAKLYAERAEAIRRAFNARWRKTVPGGGVFYDCDAQTANALPVSWGLADAADASGLVARVTADIARHHNSVTSGEIGYPHVLRALQTAGADETIYAMTCATNAPGYGFMVANGETSLHEAWDCNPTKSHNHFMFGDIVDWLYSGLAGIRRTSPGFRTFTVRPVFVKGLDWVRASYRTYRYGKIAVAWRRTANGIEVTVTVPAGTEATIELPGVPSTVQRAGTKTYLARPAA